MTMPMPPDPDEVPEAPELVALMRGNPEQTGIAMMSLENAIWFWLDAAGDDVREAGVYAITVMHSDMTDLHDVMVATPMVIYTMLLSRPTTNYNFSMACFMAAMLINDTHIELLKSMMDYYNALPEARKAVVDDKLAPDYARAQGKFKRITEVMEREQVPPATEPPTASGEHDPGCDHAPVNVTPPITTDVRTPGPAITSRQAYSSKPDENDDQRKARLEAERLRVAKQYNVDPLDVVLIDTEEDTA